MQFLLSWTFLMGHNFHQVDVADLAYYSVALTYECGIKHGVDPLVGAVIIQHESGGVANAIGPSGKDTGLMQIVPKYVPETQEELLDAWTNIEVGCRSLAFWKQSKKGDYIAHYAGGVIPHKRAWGFQKWVNRKAFKWKRRVAGNDYAWKSFVPSPLHGMFVAASTFVEESTVDDTVVAVLSMAVPFPSQAMLQIAFGDTPDEL